MSAASHDSDTEHTGDADLFTLIRENGTEGANNMSPARACPDQHDHARSSGELDRGSRFKRGRVPVLVTLLIAMLCSTHSTVVSATINNELTVPANRTEFTVPSLEEPLNMGTVALIEYYFDDMTVDPFGRSGGCGKGFECFGTPRPRAPMDVEKSTMDMRRDKAWKEKWSLRQKSSPSVVDVVGQGAEHPHRTDPGEQQNLLRHCAWTPLTGQHSCTVLGMPIDNQIDVDPPHFKFAMDNPSYPTLMGNIEITQGPDAIGAWDVDTPVDSVVRVPVLPITLGGNTNIATIRIKFVSDLTATAIVFGFGGGIPAGVYGVGGLSASNSIGEVKRTGDKTYVSAVANDAYQAVEIKPSMGYSEVYICAGAELTLSIARIGSLADSVLKAYPVLNRLNGIASKVIGGLPISSSEADCDTHRLGEDLRVPTTTTSSRQLSTPQDVRRVYTQLYILEMHGGDAAETVLQRR